MKRYETELFKQLVSIQNSAYYSNVDILTITGFMNDIQFKEYALVKINNANKG